MGLSSFLSLIAFLSPPATTVQPLHPILPSSCLNMVHTEAKLQQLGITLPPPPKAAANYVPVNRVGDLLYLSGHIPLKQDGTLIQGCIDGGDEFNVDYGYQAATQVGLNLIASLQHELGDLDRVEKIVKLFGIVQSSNNFKEQHLVVNGCSDLLVQVFGSERGMHARSAIGTNCLPLNIAVEIEAIVQVRPE